MRPLVTAGQVAAHRRAGMGGGSAEMGAGLTGPRRLHAPPRQAASSSPCTTPLSPRRFLDSSSAHSLPHPWTPRWCPRRPYLAGLPAPGRHQLPARFRTLETERKGGGGRGRGRGGAGRQRGDLRAITRSGNGAHPAAGASRPLQSLGSEVVVEGTQGPSLFLGLHEGEVRGGIWGPS